MRTSEAWKAKSKEEKAEAITDTLIENMDNVEELKRFETLDAKCKVIAELASVLDFLIGEAREAVLDHNGIELAMEDEVDYLDSYERCDVYMNALCYLAGKQTCYKNTAQWMANAIGRLVECSMLDGEFLITADKLGLYRLMGE